MLEQVLRWFGASGHNWLGSKSTALPALMVVTIWKEAGFFMIFYLAALQSMSPHLAEAADIEGGKARQNYLFQLDIATERNPVGLHDRRVDDLELAFNGVVAAERRGACGGANRPRNIFELLEHAHVNEESAIVSRLNQDNGTMADGL